MQGVWKGVLQQGRRRALAVEVDGILTAGVVIDVELVITSPASSRPEPLLSSHSPWLLSTRKSESRHIGHTCSDSGSSATALDSSYDFRVRR